MAEAEIEPIDRVYDVVMELLHEGETPHEILDRAKDAIREWRFKEQVGSS